MVPQMREKVERRLKRLDESDLFSEYFDVVKGEEVMSNED